MDIGGLPGLNGLERLVSGMGVGCDRGRPRHRFCPRTRRWSGLSENYRLYFKGAAQPHNSAVSPPTHVNILCYAKNF